jgi:hypothetical protein
MIQGALIRGEIIPSSIEWLVNEVIIPLHDFDSDISDIKENEHEKISN